MKKRLLAGLMTLAMCLILLPTTALAAGETGDFTVTGGTLDADYSYAGNILTILTDTELTISGNTTTDRIVVNSGVTAALTLDNVKIDFSGVSGQGDQTALTADGAVTVILQGENVLAGGNEGVDIEGEGDKLSGCPAVQIETNGSLTIQGDGSLSVRGGRGHTANNSAVGDGGAGIVNRGALYVESGRVEITGGNAGGNRGFNNRCGNAGAGVDGDLTVTGGYVSITGGKGGYSNNFYFRGGTGGRAARAVDISGGTVLLTGGNGGDAGYDGQFGNTGVGSAAAETVNITGGVLVATGGKNGNSNQRVKGIGTLTESGDRLVLLTANNKDQHNTGAVYGNITLQENFTLNAGDTLTIPAGASLTVPDGVKLTLDGTLNVEENGRLAIEGELTGSGEIAPDDIKFPRDEADRPDAPTIQNATTDTIKLKAIDGAEYRVDDGDWQDSTTFSGLSAGTAYTFYARYKATGLYQASEPSAGTTQYTVAPPASGEGYIYDYVQETVTALDGYEVRIFYRNEWVKTLQITPSNPWVRNSFYIRRAKTDVSAASDEVQVYPPYRPAAPTTVLGVNVSAGGESDGKITGVDTTMEYRRAGDNTWTTCPDGEITGLPVGSYEVRFKAIENTTFASLSVTPAVREPATTVSFCLNDGSIEISEDNGSLVVKQNEREYTLPEKEVRITGNGESTPNTIQVTGATAHITLDDVQISASNYFAIDLQYANVALTLEGENALSGGFCGIILEGDNDLTIDGSGTLTMGSSQTPVGYGINLNFGDSNVTIDGGVVDITSQYAAIGGYDGTSSITINGGVVRAEVSRGGGRGLGATERADYSYGPMSVNINGGTVELTGTADQINALSEDTPTDCSVTVTGGSVTTGGITPAPTNGADPVYAVTIDDVGSGTVDAFLLKQGDAALTYGAPACATTDGKLILYLPEGEYSGSAIVGGRLISFTCEARADGTAAPSTVTDTGFAIAAPEGETPIINNNGTVRLPSGTTVTKPDGATVFVPNGGTLDPATGKVTQNGGSSGGGSSSSKPSASVDGVGGKVSAGSNGTVTITPDEGYQIEKITVNGKDVEIPADGRLTGLKSSDRVVAAFTEIPAVTAERFADVAPGAWYYDAVEYAVVRGLFYGTSDTTFRPNVTMTCGMLATVLYRMEGEPEAGPAAFLDVKTGRYYSEAVAWAAENGIVAGYGDGTFGPEDAITREQLAAILWRDFGSPAAAETLAGFVDTDRASSYALDALRWAVEQGILQGKGDGILDPAGKAARAEVAAMLMRYCEGTGR